ncbi:fibrinogen and fibronectin [Culex quinquefasciatus]|uniref:Fibrinogen and fibronectin n=1 Tax=Culex quinquefasciatus TaxID=7176 RepID=B0WHG2_CULQU|nr:fibrinogen and fibronectin [Culex quinquefasciatus]|eukprot:XP_001848146.1 fibrinogen and fibronectin [Culex quinquefasciatus]
MDSFDGGWLVVQHRFDGSVNFTRSWKEYQNGFGLVGKSTEFWLGLKLLHLITTSQDYELVIELKDKFNYYGYAHYSDFMIVHPFPIVTTVDDMPIRRKVFAPTASKYSFTGLAPEVERASQRFASASAGEKFHYEARSAPAPTPKAAVFARLASFSALSLTFFGARGGLAECARLLCVLRERNAQGCSRRRTVSARRGGYFDWERGCRLQVGNSRAVVQ